MIKALLSLVLACAALLPAHVHAAYTVTIAAGPSTGGSWVGSTWVPTASPSVVAASDVEAKLLGGPTTITTGDGGSDSGNIVVSAALTWSDTTLILSATNDITIDAPLTGTGAAALVLEYGQRWAEAFNPSTYSISTPVSLQSNPDDPTGTANFSTKRGYDGATVGRAVPLCPVVGRGGVVSTGCSFLKDSDLTSLQLGYGTIAIDGFDDGDVWIHVDGRNLFGQDPFTAPYFPYVFACEQGKGTLYYPNNKIQANYFDSDGVITDLAGINAVTTTTRPCKSWENGPVLPLFYSSDFPNGYYIKFRPDPGMIGTPYQIMTVLFADHAQANTGYIAVDYMINIYSIGAPPQRPPRPVGYWRRNPSQWPVTTLQLGDEAYSRRKLLALLRRGAGTDASRVLVKQLVAAKLNVASSAARSSIIASTIADADALLRTYRGRLPYEVKRWTSAGRAMTDLAAVLRAYNRGL